MKIPKLLIALTFLSAATLVSCPIISAEKTIVQAQEVNLNTVQAYIFRGLSYYDQGKYELAITEFSRAIDEIGGPYNADVYYYRGLSYYDQGKYELAIAD
ncbi:MAG: tetratricopeptide repeat protein, partial [Waterburya sp.]